MKVAILGANGFIGFRLFERWIRQCARGERQFDPRAIVRSPAGLARIARFESDWRITDARNYELLLEAFRGCHAVVHCVTGDSPVIEGSISPVVRASAGAGVKRIIFLSSASIHGLRPAADVTESSPLSDKTSSWYINSKVRAERALLTLCREMSVGCVILRPGIVFGPRSRWVSNVADQLLAGRASWIRGGHGILNSIFVDNLIHAIERCLEADGAAGEAFLVGDAETVRWRDLYLGIAGALGFPEQAFAEAKPQWPKRTMSSALADLKSSHAVQAILPLFPAGLKRSVKAALLAARAPVESSPWELPEGRPAPEASSELTELFHCENKLSYSKAEQLLNYAPPVTFSQGVELSIEWLELAGYPVRDRFAGAGE